MVFKGQAEGMESRIARSAGARVLGSFRGVAGRARARAGGHKQMRELKLVLMREQVLARSLRAAAGVSGERPAGRPG